MRRHLGRAGVAVMTTPDNRSHYVTQDSLLAVNHRRMHGNNSPHPIEAEAPNVFTPHDPVFEQALDAGTRRGMQRVQTARAAAIAGAVAEAGRAAMPVLEAEMQLGGDHQRALHRSLRAGVAAGMAAAVQRAAVAGLPAALEHSIEPELANVTAGRGAGIRAGLAAFDEALPSYVAQASSVATHAALHEATQALLAHRAGAIDEEPNVYAIMQQSLEAGLARGFDAVSQPMVHRITAESLRVAMDADQIGPVIDGVR